MTYFNDEHDIDDAKYFTKEEALEKLISDTDMVCQRTCDTGKSIDNIQNTVNEIIQIMKEFIELEKQNLVVQQQILMELRSSNQQHKQQEVLDKVKKTSNSEKRIDDSKEVDFGKNL